VDNGELLVRFWVFQISISNRGRGEGVGEGMRRGWGMGRGWGRERGRSLRRVRKRGMGKGGRG
jgi:hypothetical protein